MSRRSHHSQEMVNQPVGWDDVVEQAEREAALERVPYTAPKRKSHSSSDDSVASASRSPSRPRGGIVPNQFYAGLGQYQSDAPAAAAAAGAAAAPAAHAWPAPVPRQRNVEYERKMQRKLHGQWRSAKRANQRDPPKFLNWRQKQQVQRRLGLPITDSAMPSTGRDTPPYESSRAPSSHGFVGADAHSDGVRSAPSVGQDGAPAGPAPRLRPARSEGDASAYLRRTRRPRSPNSRPAKRRNYRDFNSKGSSETARRPHGMR